MRLARKSAQALCGLAMVLCLASCSDKDQTKTGEAAGPDRTVLKASEARDWPTYGGQPTSTQYSSLTRINRSNVSRLKVAWTYHTGELSKGTKTVDATVYETTPIFVNNRLYLCTPFNHIVALDPGTGKELWRFDPKKPLTGNIYHSQNCRGVSYWAAERRGDQKEFCGKRIFETMSNGVLLAVDADTGKPCTDFGANGRINLNRFDYKGEGRVASSSPPAIYKNVVIVGGSVEDNRWANTFDGIVRGFDARTGKQLWSWNPIPAAMSARTGAANTWAPMSVDKAHGWVFLPTGSPSLDAYGGNRKDPIPYGNAVVALDALTGKVVWSFQAVHHDLWDYDMPSAPTLVTVNHDGKDVEAVMQATKMGYVFLLDRVTGKPLFPVREQPAPQSDVPGERSAPTQPVPALPAPVTSQSVTPDDAWGALIFDKMKCRDKIAKLRNDGLFTPPSLQGSILHPSFLGGTDWGGVAYDEASGIAVLNSSNVVSSVTLIPRDKFDPRKYDDPEAQVFDMKGSPYIAVRQVLLSPLGAPCNAPPWGNLTAIDMNTGKTLWHVPFGRVEFWGLVKTLPSWGAPNQGGPIITAGGLVFIGASPDNVIRAYDLKTGRRVWSGPLPAPAMATPMTYEYGKRQYVVISAGGYEGFKTDTSDSFVAFALPE